MEADNSYKCVYIVISQTGTILSRILKFITRREYNHVSISLENDLSIMYSFGRKHPYNPFWGGFVRESVNFGTFKRFQNTKALVLEVDVGDVEYEKLNTRINKMLLNSGSYKYNYLGLCLAGLNIRFKSQNRYYCSEFVKDLLIYSNISGADDFGKIVHPMSFITLPDIKEVYCGRLGDYRSAQKVTF